MKTVKTQTHVLVRRRLSWRRFVMVTALGLIATGTSHPRAAAEAGTIAVLDFVPQYFVAPAAFNGINNQLTTLDTSDDDVPGTVTLYQEHSTPLRSDGSLNLRQIRTTPAAMSATVALHRRGASSKTFPKKGYAMEFTSPPGSFFKTGTDWTLHACYADATCLRNVMAYWQASKLFPWAPRTEFVELFVNGYYRGLYVAIEKIKLGADRVTLPAPTDSAVSGGYIMERSMVNAPDDPSDWQSPIAPNTFWTLADPKKKRLTSAQFSYINTFMSSTARNPVSFESRFNPSDATDYDASHYGKYLDEQSLADFIFMQEISRNVDGYAKSQYITKYPLPAGLVHMGPVWDFDLAFGNFQENGYSVCDATSPDWRIDQHPQVVYQPLWETWKQPNLRRAMAARWKKLRDDGTISRTRFDSAIDAFAARISAARARDNSVWKNLESLEVIKRTSLSSTGASVPWPLWECRNYQAATVFQNEISKLKQFVRTRIDWMDMKIANEQFLTP